jgi:hypothetical protein
LGKELKAVVVKISLWRTEKFFFAVHKSLM